MSLNDFDSEKKSLNLDEPVLLVFDMDSTIIEKNTDLGIIDLLNLRSERKIDGFNYSKDWTITMRDVFQNLKKLNYNVNDVKSIIESIELNDGFKEVFHFLTENKHIFDSIIISGSNTLFAEWIVKKNKLDHLFHNIYSNKASICEDNLIKIERCHTHECESCNPCQCKRIILNDYLKEKQIQNKLFSRKVFIGDGENDFCPGKDFDNNDYVLGRYNFPLDLLVNKLMSQKKFSFKYNYLNWKNGHDIIKILRMLKKK